MKKNQRWVAKQQMLISPINYEPLKITMKLLEKYVELSRSQFQSEKRRSLVNEESFNEIFSTALLELNNGLKDMSDFFREESKQEFYKWIDATRINVNNCPERLKRFLLEFNKILEGRGEKLAREALFLSCSTEEELKTFDSIQTPRQWEREQNVFLEGKHYKDLELTSKFNANVERGKEAFEQIAKSVVNMRDEFHFFSWREKSPQQIKDFSINSQIIQDLKINPQNWRIDEIPTELDSFGIVKKQEFVLIHRNARLDDYNQEGKLNFTSNPMFRANQFNQEEIDEINKALNISSGNLVEGEIRWVVKEVKDNPSIWQVKAIDGQVYLVHNSAQIKEDEIGTLIHSEQKFSKTEWTKISESLSNIAYQQGKDSAPWYCNNCNSYQDSWAEHQYHNPDETYRRDIRCWKCNNWTLIYTDSQKERYRELVKERTSISGTIYEVERFSTWWSNNIATAIYYYEGCYRVTLLVYDPVYSTYQPAMFPDAYNSTRNWGDGGVRGFHNELFDAQREAEWLRNELAKGYGKYHDNPILLIHPYCDVYRPYCDYVHSSCVARKEVGDCDSTHFVLFVSGGGTIPSNLDNHFRPLDVVKVKEVSKNWGVRYYHFGVYLGNGEICHFTSRMNSVLKTDWQGFLKDQIGELYKYHPVIPFKHYDKISRQIAYSLSTDEKFFEGCYDLHNRNCEHFANAIGFGINYSEQVYDNRAGINTKEGSKAFFAGFTLGSSLLVTDKINGIINNDKGSTIKLVNEINETEDILGYTKASHFRAKETKERYLQEVPPKEYCKIM